MKDDLKALAGPGVEVRPSSIRIKFYLNGKSVWEAITQITKVNANAVRYANNKRAAIITEIKEGRFDYLAHFPNSKRALSQSGRLGKDVDRTVTQGVETYLQVIEAKKATSTFNGYKSKARHICNRWPSDRIKDVTRSELELFQSQLIAYGLSPKTVNDIFTIARGVWSDAFHDEILTTNPMDRIRNLEIDREETADPFNREEIRRIEGVCSEADSEGRFFRFAMWSGLSLSEMCGLAWEDIDTEQWTVKVQRARVENEYKVPKEKSRIRVVELVEPAKAILMEQMASTAMLPAVDISIKRRDNITVKGDSVRFVFLNEFQSQVSPWHATTALRRFGYLLRRAGVRHRGPNQCRHTFASQCLSHFVSMEWLARQLGHADTTMIKRHYGKWIPQDTPSMARVVSEQLGFHADSGGLEKLKTVPKSSQI